MRATQNGVRSPSDPAATSEERPHRRQASPRLGHREQREHVQQAGRLDVRHRAAGVAHPPRPARAPAAPARRGSRTTPASAATRTGRRTAAWRPDRRVAAAPPARRRAAALESFSHGRPRRLCSVPGVPPVTSTNGENATRCVGGTPPWRDQLAAPPPSARPPPAESPTTTTPSVTSAPTCVAPGRPPGPARPSRCTSAPAGSPGAPPAPRPHGQPRGVPPVRPVQAGDEPTAVEVHHGSRPGRAPRADTSSHRQPAPLIPRVRRATRPTRGRRRVGLPPAPRARSRRTCSGSCTSPRDADTG